MGMIMKDGIPYGGIYPIDDAPTQGSNNAVKSGGVFNSLSNKVDKVAGKGLSTNDYDNTEKEKNAANAGAIEAIVNATGSCNILPNNASTTTVSEITFTVNADKSVTATGNQPSTYRSIALCTGLLLKAGTYVLSKVEENDSPLYLYMSNDDQSGVEIATCLTTPVSFTLASDTHVSVLAVVRPNHGAVNDTIYPMLYDARLNPTGYVQYAMTNAELTEATELLTCNAPNDITARVSNLPIAVAQQNLEKYGYKIGDYFDGINYRYWLGHLNYNYGGYDAYAVLGTLNIGLVVDTKSNSQWNTSNDTTGGYENSALHTYLKGTVLDNIKADLKSLFGGSTGLEHLIAETKLFASIGTWGWSSSAEYISALTEVNVYGCPIWSADNFQQGEADQQLEIFRKYKYNRIFGNNDVWLRSICSASEACYAGSLGDALYYGASLSFRAAGLIIFH